MKKKVKPTDEFVFDLMNKILLRNVEIDGLRMRIRDLEEENEKLKDERAYLQRLCATHEAKIESLEKDCEILRGKNGELHKRLNTGRGPGRRREMYALQEELVEAVKGAVERWYWGEE